MFPSAFIMQVTCLSYHIAFMRISSLWIVCSLVDIRQKLQNDRVSGKKKNIDWKNIGFRDRRRMH